MLFLQLIEFILYLLAFIYRKKICKSPDNPSLAEIFNRNKQEKISAA